jgi:acyl-CoA oxidase
LLTGVLLPPPQVDSIRAAKAHGQLVLLRTFVDSVAEAERLGRLRGASVAVLRQLAALFGLTLLEAAAGDLLEAGYLGGQQAAALRAAQRAHLALLRPNAVALVDAFGLTDYELNSALGRGDGDVYRSLLEMARGSPLNESEEGPAWEGVLKPVMLRARAKL